MSVIEERILRSLHGILKRKKNRANKKGKTYIKGENTE